MSQENMESDSEVDQMESDGDEVVDQMESKLVHLCASNVLRYVDMVYPFIIMRTMQ
jgi:hypothetical protein